MKYFISNRIAGEVPVGWNTEQISMRLDDDREIFPAGWSSFVQLEVENDLDIN